MTPMLGIMASAATGSKQSSYESIATATGTGASSTITLVLFLLLLSIYK